MVKNDVERYLDFAKQQASLGDAEIALAVKVKEERQGRIFTDRNKAKVFEPLTKPISEILRKGLFSQDETTGEFTPLLTRNPISNKPLSLADLPKDTRNTRVQRLQQSLQNLPPLPANASDVEMVGSVLQGVGDFINYEFLPSEGDAETEARSDLRTAISSSMNSIDLDMTGLMNGAQQVAQDIRDEVIEKLKESENIEDVVNQPTLELLDRLKTYAEKGQITPQKERYLKKYMESLDKIENLTEQGVMNDQKLAILTDAMLEIAIEGKLIDENGNIIVSFEDISISKNMLNEELEKVKNLEEEDDEFDLSDTDDESEKTKGTIEKAKGTTDKDIILNLKKKIDNTPFVFDPDKELTIDRSKLPEKPDILKRYNDYELGIDPAIIGDYDLNEQKAIVNLMYDISIDRKNNKPENPDIILRNYKLLQNNDFEELLRIQSEKEQVVETTDPVSEIPKSKELLKGLFADYEYNPPSGILTQQEINDQEKIVKELNNMADKDISTRIKNNNKSMNSKETKQKLREEIDKMALIVKDIQKENLKKLKQLQKTFNEAEEQQFIEEQEQQAAASSSSLTNQEKEWLSYKRFKDYTQAEKTAILELMNNISINPTTNKIVGRDTLNQNKGLLRDGKFKELLNKNKNSKRPPLSDTTQIIIEQYAEKQLILGKGITKHNFTVDLQALKKGLLKVKNNKTGTIVINKKVDASTIDIFSKPYYALKKYSPEALKNYELVNKLMDKKDDLKLDKIKSKLSTPTAVSVFTNPSDMLDKLELIFGSMGVGNNSNTMKNEGRAILDELLKIDAITKEEHKELYKKLN